MRDLYQEITNTIVAQLEAGTVPWVKPWRDKGGMVEAGLPYNAVTKRQYNGINVPILWGTGGAKGYAGGGWLTFNQARKAGGMVRKGERGTMIVFAQQVTRENDDGKTRSFPILKSFTVFHVSQCDGLPDDVNAIPETPKVEPDHVLDWVCRAGARVEHGGNRAFYTTARDHIQMPMKKDFRDAESYAATLLHEATHWSGGPARLNRTFGKRFGDDAYAAEELVAEIGAAFLCGRLGIRGQLQHADYIASWLKVLRNDKRAIFTAASAASKAADYLAGQAGEDHGEEDKPEEASNVVPFPAPVAMPAPVAKPKVYVDPIPYADDYTARGDQNAVSLLGIALATQAEACRKGRKYSGTFPLSAHQRSLYSLGIGLASGYWRQYAADQSRKPAPNPQAVAEELARVWDRAGHIPSAGAVAGNVWLEDWRKRVLSGAITLRGRRVMAEAAE